MEKDYNFSYSSSIKELKQDVVRLKNIICTNEIDVVHVHPWFTLIPALMAIKDTNVKLFYTSHGYESICFHHNIYDQLIMESILNEYVCNIFCVSSLCEELLNSIGIKNTSLLPNPIDSDLFAPANIAHNKKWALVSRLDSDKIGIIRKLLTILPMIDIDEVDIYGNGEYYEEVHTLAKKCSKKVNLKGYSNTIQNSLHNGYFGLIGIGRAAIEGIAMGFPVLFAGYGKICGLIDKENLSKISITNFVPKTFPEISIQELNRQLANCYNDPSSFCLRNEIRSLHGVSYTTDLLLEKYETELSLCDYSKINELYDKISKLDTSTHLYNNKTIFDLFSSSIGLYSYNNLLRDKILQTYHTDLFTSDISVSQNRTDDSLVILESKLKEIQQLKQQYDKLFENMSDELAYLRSRTIGFYIKDWFMRHFVR